jgi:AbrB family looped-hinge helix DNA binding protein
VLTFHVGVTLPKPIRDTFNLEAGDELELIDKKRVCDV